MTKAELKTRLEAGEIMDELFHYTRGDLCLIFSADDFKAGDEIIYIPDIDLNELVMDRPANAEEIETILNCCYTGDDFIKEVREYREKLGDDFKGYGDISVSEGDMAKAEQLFWYCDWEHPSSATYVVFDDDDE